MAEQQHVEIVKRGQEALAEWREEHPSTRLKLSEADLSGVSLSGADLSEAFLGKVNFSGADLSAANLYKANLFGANLFGANLYGANLCGAHLFQANLFQANLRGAYLSGASLRGANLHGAILFEATICDADLTRTSLVETDLRGADLRGCRIYGISAWNPILDEETKQSNLVITPWDEPSITVDQLEVAQFIYLMLHNEKIRDVIDTMTSKAVLILGRFKPERKAVLDAIREELRHHDLVPIMFDFDAPAGASLTETVTLLARMARFIVADLTEPSSIPQELQAIIPDVEVPVQPLLQEGFEPWAMFWDFRNKPWVLAIHRYRGIDDLLTDLPAKVIAPAEEKGRELGRTRPLWN